LLKVGRYIVVFVPGAEKQHRAYVVGIIEFPFISKACFHIRSGVAAVGLV